MVKFLSLCALLLCLTLGRPAGSLSVDLDDLGPTPPYEDEDDQGPNSFWDETSPAGRRYHSNSDLRSRAGNRDVSPIMFPTEPLHRLGNKNASISAYPQNDPRRRPKVPLKLLRHLSHENDVSQVFEKYVSNVKLQEVKGQKYLVDLRGQPIEAGLGGRVIIQPSTERPKTRPGPGAKPFSPFSTNGFSDRNIATPERAGGSQRVSQPAICEPELRTVEVPANDPNIILFPKCVRLERCGGCCGSDLLTCEATRTKLTEIQVQKFAYNDETEKLEYRETEVMNLPSHTECRCNCRVKSSDCSPKHAYSGEDCLCICKNRGEQEACLKQPHKLWDSNLCQCVCREIKPCSSNLSFNIDTCECAPYPEGRSLPPDPTRRRRREHNQSQRRRTASQRA